MYSKKKVGVRVIQRILGEGNNGKIKRYRGLSDHGTELRNPDALQRKRYICDHPGARGLHRHVCGEPFGRGGYHFLRLGRTYRNSASSERESWAIETATFLCTFSMTFSNSFRPEIVSAPRTAVLVHSEMRSVVV